MFNLALKSFFFVKNRPLKVYGNLNCIFAPSKTKGIIFQCYETLSGHFAEESFTCIFFITKSQFLRRIIRPPEQISTAAAKGSVGWR